MYVLWKFAETYHNRNNLEAKKNRVFNDQMTQKFKYFYLLREERGGGGEEISLRGEADKDVGEW